MATASSSASNQSKAHKQRFKTRLQHRRMGGSLTLRLHGRAEGDRREPILVDLPPVTPATTPDPRPCVRIYVGTEPAQFRAERVLVWSILKHRDPGRHYQVYLMSNLRGFDRSDWKTGFTNYRYAVPGLAGFQGRAIYNDVDQIYFSDPALLFDTPMQDHAVLSIDERETSVMLLDCEKLRDIWPLAQAQGASHHKRFRAQVHNAGLWGTMDAAWNARDDEYRAGTSHLLHYTTLHKQPWQPFPELLKYEPNPLAGLWTDLEAEADAARFTLFTEQSPSPRYQELIAMYGSMHDEGRPETGHGAGETFSGRSLVEHIPHVAELVKTTGAASILDYGSGKAGLYQPAPGYPAYARFKSMPAWGETVITCYDPGYEPFSGPYEDKYDGVITTDVLEHIPAEDIPWVLRHLFRHAGKFLYAVAACFPAKKILPDGTNAHCTVTPPDWWAAQMQQAAREFPGVRWRLCTQEKSYFAFDQRKKLRKKGIRNRFFSG
ncbi:MAG: class I SAM-dependent methyltransferase [Pseudomonadales bacterium]